MRNTWLLSCGPGLRRIAAGPTSFSGVTIEQVLAADKPDATTAAGWDRQAAARYLDSREVWWQSWDRAQKDHKTLCVSCHTQAPYGLARPALRHELSEQGPSPSEQVMLAALRSACANGIKCSRSIATCSPEPGRKSNRATPSRCLIP